MGTARPAAAQAPVQKRLKILLLQGANLSYLGRREPELYGTTTATELYSIMSAHARTHGYDIEIFYTHIEGEAIGRLYRAVDEGFDGVGMNPGGFTYSGYALRDCLRALPFPYIEVHITNLDKRGIHSVIAEVAVELYRVSVRRLTPWGSTLCSFVLHERTSRAGDSDIDCDSTAGRPFVTDFVLARLGHAEGSLGCPGKGSRQAAAAAAAPAEQVRDIRLTPSPDRGGRTPC